MSKKIYIKLNRNNEIRDPVVKVSDVAEVYCHDASTAGRVKTLVIAHVEGAGTDKPHGVRISISAIRVIEIITNEIQGADVENIGEPDFIVDYVPENEKSLAHRVMTPKVLNFFKVIAICVITFMGSAYAIMAYDNDVGTMEIFARAYEMLLGEKKGDSRLLEIMFSIGLTLGIAVFYNHFGGKSFSNDPTPIEVEMNNYELDIDNALIERGARSGRELE